MTMSSQSLNGSASNANVGNKVVKLNKMEMAFGTMNIFDIRDRAQGSISGKVSQQEVEFARDILRSHWGEIGAALTVVGLCGERTDAELIEPYLRGDERSVYGETALKALCRYLGLIDIYRPLVRSLIMEEVGLGWDQGSMAAIHLADVYFANFRDDELGLRLVDIMGEEGNPNRRAARSALIRTLDLRDMLSEPFALEFSITDADSGTITAAANRRFNRHKLN